MAKKKSVLLILIVMLAFFAFAGLASCGTHAGNSESNSETVKETETAGQTETTSGTETTGETTSETAGETTSESTVAPEVKYTVKFMNGETEVASVEVKEGETVAQADIPVAPVSDYVFYGWFNGEVEFDAAAAVTADVTYVAKFSSVKAEHIGEWRGEGKDGNANAVAYVLTVTGETVSLKVGAAEAVAATDLAYNDNGELTFKLGDEAYSFGMWYNYYICNADYSVNVDVSLVYDKPVEFGEEALVGAYETEAGVKIVINSTFVLVDGVQGTDFTSSSSGYSFYIDGVSASVSYNTEAWYYSVGGESDKIKTPVKEPVAIPEALIGNWSAVVEDATWGTTLYLVTITPDGLSVYYSEAFSWSEVVASYEAVEGGVVFNVDGDKITVTATADGKIKYVGNYTDVALEKKIRIAFVNDYQIYYVADLKDDGTIDEENFALEDPVKEHNHFDGWFNQVGGAAFDFSATFEKGAYFEAKWTETEIPVKFDDITVYVPVTDGVAKLTDVLIPAAPAAEEGKAFMGWYNGNVKAAAGLEVKKDAKFVSYFASEADYAGYWTCNEAGKESMLAVVDGKLTFGEDFKRIQYTYADGQLSVRIGTIRYTWLNVEKTMTGVVVSIKYYDEYDELVTDKYVLEPVKAVKGVIPAGTYKSTNSDGFIINEDGVVTNCGSSLDAAMYSYVSGTASNLTIKFVDGGGNLTEYKNVRVKDGKIICGKLTADAKIYVKDPKSFKDTSEVNYAFTLYAYTVVNKDGDGNDQESVIYVINKKGQYAEVTVTGEIKVGNIVTLKYTFYNGAVANKKSFEEQYIVNSKGKFAAPGEEKGEYTSETLGTLKLDGFGNATVTNGEDVKTYVYVINGAGVVVLKNAEGAVVDGVKLAEGNTFAKAEVIGEYGYFIKSDNDKYSLTLDGFGGISVYYNSYYPSEYIGSYTVAEDGSIVATGSELSTYKGTWTVAEGGKVLINGNKIFIAEGYTPVNHIDEFAGYYVNGDNVVKIVVADGKATVLVNKVDVKAKANWNGTILTYSAKDEDAGQDKYKTWSRDFVITLIDGNIVITHDCIQGYDDIYDELTTEKKSVTYTAAEEPVELDAFAGTWVNGSLKFIFDGKGTVTNEGGVTATYSIVGGKAKFVINYLDIECTINGNEMNVYYDDVDYPYSKTFTKQADEAADLDAFAGNWKVYDTVFAFDGKGTVVVTGSSFDGTFSYTVSGDTVTFKNTRLNEVITCKLSGADAILVSCECGEEYSNTKFTKQ